MALFNPQGQVAEVKSSRSMAVEFIRKWDRSGNIGPPSRQGSSTESGRPRGRIACVRLDLTLSCVRCRNGSGADSHRHDEHRQGRPRMDRRLARA